jgi:hypothetical protein
MTATIDNTQDILDSRDVLARLQELEDERDESEEPDRRNQWDDENGDELKALKAFVGESSDEWRHGVALIRESYFQEYAQELAEDIGALKDAGNWPCTCIDWDRAAAELQQDYTGADFDGVTYYYLA